MSENSTFVIHEWDKKPRVKIPLLVVMIEIKIDLYFTEWAPKVVFPRVAKLRVKIPLLVIQEWNKKSMLHWKKIKFSVSFML